MASRDEPSVIFPSEGYQFLSTLVHLLGCSVLAFCLARRSTVHALTFNKLCVMGIFADSWLFLFSGGIVVHGVGMSLNADACISGIYLCIFFYASSKVLIYIFLAERVHMVWSAGAPVRRFKSRIWIVCAVVLMGYVVIFILMLIGRIGYIRPDRVCVIGVKSMATIPLLTYDVFLNVFLTSLFVYPLLRRDLSHSHAGLHALAKKTCWAAAVALGTSVVNILVLTLLHGRQLGWVCLASCGFDVTVNAGVILLITQPSEGTTPTTSKARENFTTVHEAGVITQPAHVHLSLSPVKAVFPVLRTKKRRPNTVETLSYPDEEPHLSKIGDFAATRDDGLRSNGLISMIREPSRTGQRRELATPASLIETEYQYQMQNIRQTIQKPKRSDNPRSSKSLEELKEEEGVTPGSQQTPFYNGILMKVEEDTTSMTDETSKRPSIDR